MNRPKRRRQALLLVALLSIAMAPASSTLARFVDSVPSTGTFATDTLDPPTGLLAIGGSSVILTWTPSLDGYATGYDIYRSAVSGSGYSLVSSVTPGLAPTTTDAPGPGTWYYVLRTTFQSWSSVISNQASAIVSGPTSTAFVTCASTAADTVNAGDDDGYEANPARACADDSSFATDSTSGNGGTASCGAGAVPDTTKDSHRFSGFAFGLPGSVSSVAGIRVRADLGTNNNGGTTNLCAQLSWDGGASWTTIKTVAVGGTGETTYILGSTADAWGHTWTAAELGASAFQLRIIDASTQANKQFRLDYVAVSVSYLP
ncbi:MAG: fibronectin type III domain-containing protein [Chloroflexota bacterium]